MDHEKGSEPRVKKQGKRREEKDAGVWIQNYLGKSLSPEETLFKLNEILYADRHRGIRKNVRAPFPVQVSINIDGSVQKSTVYTLSQKGAFIKHPSPPPAGRIIDVYLTLPDEGPLISVKGNVVESIPIDKASAKGVLSGMSVVFTDVSATDRKRIDKLVKDKAKRMQKP